MSTESARISGLGINNYIARYGDSHTWLVNPAGMASQEGNQVIATYGERFSRNIAGGSVCLTIKNCGLIFDSTTVDSIEKRDDSGNYICEESLQDLNLSAAYGLQLTSSLALGAGISILEKNLQGKYSWGASANLGALYKHSELVSFGVVLENLGARSSLKREGNTHMIPLTVRAGCQVSPVKDFYLLGGGSFNGKTGANFNLGAEYNLLRSVVLRVGYDGGRRSYGPLSAGLGINIQDICKIDYGFNTHPELGYSGVLTVTFHFNMKSSKPVTMPQPPETQP